MADCASCGRSPSPSDRFCAACGSMLQAAGDTEEVGSGPLIDTDRPLLIGRSAESAPTVDGGVKVGPGRWWLVAIAGLVLVLVAGLASILGGDGGGSEPVDGNLDALREAGATVDPAAVDGPNGDDEGDDDETEDEAGDDEGEDDVGEAAAAGNGADDDDDAESPTAADGPPLGVETGLGIVLGAENSDVTVLDLDTGEQTVLEGARGLPIGVIGSTVILNRAGTIRTVDLDDPTGGAELMVMDFEAFGPEQMLVRDDLLWATDSFGSRENTITAYSAEGDEVTSIQLPPDLLLLPTVGLPDLVQTLPGGIYRFADERFERVSDGLLLAAGERIALVRECDAELDCTTIWYDKDPWRRIDLPIPDIDTRSLFGQLAIVGNDRRLLQANFEQGPAEVKIWDVETGRLVTETGVNLATGQLPTVSPDGRWLLELNIESRSVTVIDLDDGPNARSFEDVWVPNASGVFFELDGDG